MFDLYKDILSSIGYSISFDFGDTFRLYENYTDFVFPLFLTVLGIRVGISLFRYCLS